MSSTNNFPDLRAGEIDATRDALHAYARILGNWLKSCRPRRKHWWHASLRPSLHGLTTGVVDAGTGFELELDLRNSLLCGRTNAGAELTEPLQGQSVAELADRVATFLTSNGVDDRLIPEIERGNIEFAGYDPESAGNMAGAIHSISAAMLKFRAGIPEETSPIQLWPHHFDLSMIWLPGEKIPGQDPADEEYSDKQMNFGFAFGDAGIPDPYFYVTAYPAHDGFAGLPMPSGASWRTEGFNGAVLFYESLRKETDPTACLLTLWHELLANGRDLMLDIT